MRTFVLVVLNSLGARANLRWETDLRMLGATKLFGYARTSRALALLFPSRPHLQPVSSFVPKNAAASRCDSRSHPRANLAITGELRHNSECAPVVIGNLSRGGAMLKTSVLVTPGAIVHLVRGGLWSEATVIWCSGNRCGLAFSEEIQLCEWVLPLSNVGQRRINQVIALVKTGKAACEATQAASGTPPQRCARPQLRDDLRIVLKLLTDLLDDLTSSSDTVGRHGQGLRHLETAVQLLASEQFQHLSRPQLVEGLSKPFEMLGRVEDEITACEETLARHSYKLQHLDLAMQMLEEIAAGLLVGDPGLQSGSPRLPRLRATCELALRAK